jgi:hypothetical protein
MPLRYILEQHGIELILGGDQCSYRHKMNTILIGVMPKQDAWRHSFLSDKSGKLSKYYQFD